MRWIVIAAHTRRAGAAAPYPRQGATPMFDNDRIQVWDIAWLKRAYPLHRHVYDLVGVFYSPGDRIIVSETGERRPVSTPLEHGVPAPRSDAHRGGRERRAAESGVRRNQGRAAPQASDTSGTRRSRPARERRSLTTTGRRSGNSCPCPAAGHHAHRHRHDAVVVAFAAGKPSGVVHSARARRTPMRASRVRSESTSSRFVYLIFRW